MEQNNEPSYSLFSYTSSENHYNFWNTTIGSFSFGIGVFTPMPIAIYMYNALPYDLWAPFSLEVCWSFSQSY